MADFSKAYSYATRATQKPLVNLQWYNARINPAASAEDISGLSGKEQEELIHRAIWEGTPFYAIRDQNLANYFFLMVYMLGVRNATRSLQRALNMVGQEGVRVLVNGEFSHLVVANTNAVFPEHLMKTLRASFSATYRRIKRHVQEAQQHAV